MAAVAELADVAGSPAGMEPGPSLLEQEAELESELERQVETLVARGYPALSGMGEAAFRRSLEPLRARLADLALPPDSGAPSRPSRVPVVLVITGRVVPAARAISQVALRGKPAFTDMPPEDLDRFTPIEAVTLPSGMVYLLVDVDTGRETLNVTPDNAMAEITRAGRSPLTLEEGIALVTHFPELLKTHNCFSLLGSRCGDRRVPALWVMKGGAPRLGWCWAGNPHTWLGSASCGARIGLA